VERGSDAVAGLPNGYTSCMSADAEKSSEWFTAVVRELGLEDVLDAPSNTDAVAELTSRVDGCP
jgi:hypothetical protein